MIIPATDRPTGVLLSGGIDSAVLLGQLLERGGLVQPLHIRSDLVWQREEHASVRRLVAALACSRLAPLVTLHLPLADLYGPCHWSVTGHLAPDAASPDEAVYLPARNALLLVKAAVWCRLNGVPTLALGCLGNSPFVDATDDFLRRFQEVINDPPPAAVRIIRPFAGLDKRDVMELGRELPLELTFSCISPAGGIHCGGCNKCGERRAAFDSIEAPDLTPYAATVVPGACSKT